VKLWVYYNIQYNNDQFIGIGQKMNIIASLVIMKIIWSQFVSSAGSQIPTLNTCKSSYVVHGHSPTSKNTNTHSSESTYTHTGQIFS